MSEIVGSILAFFGSILVMVIREAYFKGKNVQSMTSMRTEIDGLKRELKEVQDMNGTLETLVRDNNKVMETIGELANSNSKLNQSVASLDATLKGMKEMINMIITGDISLRNQQHKKQ